MTDLASLTAALGAHYGRTYVSAPPEPLRQRGNGYSPAPSGGDNGNALNGVPVAGVRGDSSRQRIRRPGTGRDATFRAKAEHFANHPVPATARVPHGSTSRVQGRKLGASGSWEQTKADSENAARTAWVAARYNLVRDAGDTRPAGSAYPSTVTRKGNLGPAARY